jgi:RNA polymerase sigma-70 factor, ECF subfamily
MSDDGESAVDTALIGERRHLSSLAFRMLGTVTEAEDAAQETYVRWYRMDQAERTVASPPTARAPGQAARRWTSQAAAVNC